MPRIGYRSAKYNPIDTATNKYKALPGEPAAVPKMERVIDEKFAAEYNSAELYADDALAEADYSFKKGTLTITKADDDEDIEALFMGHTTATDEITKSIDDKSPEVGYGHIVTKIKNGTKSYKVEFFPRVKFTKITTDAKTKGESTEFGTTSIEGTVFPCDRKINGIEIGVWEIHKTFDTYETAEAYLNTCLTPST